MRAGALELYEEALRNAEPLVLVSQDGTRITLDVRRWLAAPDLADHSVIDRCVGPTLDVGCGPGRFVTALASRGIPSMGVDIAATAVELTRRQGVPVLLRNVFEDLPGQGRWATVLLMDGNIGIDADPYRLLTRVRSLLGPAGCALVEVDPDTGLDDVLTVRLTRGGRSAGPSFRWARLGLPALRRIALAAGYREREVWSLAGRTFALTRAPACPRRL